MPRVGKESEMEKGEEGHSCAQHGAVIAHANKYVKQCCTITQQIALKSYTSAGLGIAGAWRVRLMVLACRRSALHAGPMLQQPPRQMQNYFRPSFRLMHHQDEWFHGGPSAACPNQTWFDVDTQGLVSQVSALLVRYPKRQHEIILRWSDGLV